MFAASWLIFFIFTASYGFTPPIIAVEAPTAIDTYAIFFILKGFLSFFNSFRYVGLSCFQ
jgi:hypothetical protein